jgi:hypothetical protein
MKEQKSKPTEKEIRIEQNLRKILGDEGLEEEISKYQKMNSHWSRQCIINEIAYKIDSICICRIKLDKLPEETKEGFRKKVSSFNEKNEKSMSVVNYIMEHGIKGMTGGEE